MKYLLLSRNTSGKTDKENYKLKKNSGDLNGFEFLFLFPSDEADAKKKKENGNKTREVSIDFY